MFGIWALNFDLWEFCCVKFRQLGFDFEPLGVNFLLWKSILGLWEYFLGIFGLISGVGVYFGFLRSSLSI